MDMRAGASCMLAFVVMIGCMHWRATDLKPVPTPAPPLRLHLRDGSTLIVKEAVVSADSVLGVPWGSVPKGSRVAVPRAQVERVDVGEVDANRTTGLIFVILAVPVAVLFCAARHFRDP